jgi:hypothetical protein
MTDPRMPDGLLQWLDEGHILAGQLNASAPGYTVWVGIYPLRMELPETRSSLAREGVIVLPGVDVRAYRIRVFEIADHLRETFFAEKDLQRVQTAVALGHDQLMARLKDLGVPIEVLDSPTQVDYPL